MRIKMRKRVNIEKVFLLPWGDLIEFKYKLIGESLYVRTYNMGSGEIYFIASMLCIPFFDEDGYSRLVIPRDLFSHSLMLEELKL
jgi:hypothetical protein